MALFGMNKRPKPLQFKYVPRYYDPVKEDLKERLAGKEGSPEATKARIRSGLRRGYGGGTIDTRAQKRMSFIRLIVIIAVLVALTYSIMVADSFLELLSKLD